jgi:hypothetical protein
LNDLSARACSGRVLMVERKREAMFGVAPRPDRRLRKYARPFGSIHG